MCVCVCVCKRERKREVTIRSYVCDPAYKETSNTNSHMYFVYNNKFNN